jgi:hypothetical protein
MVVQSSDVVFLLGDPDVKVVLQPEEDGVIQGKLILGTNQQGAQHDACENKASLQLVHIFCSYMLVNRWFVGYG